MGDLHEVHVKENLVDNLFLFKFWLIILTLFWICLVPQQEPVTRVIKMILTNEDQYEGIAWKQQILELWRTHV